MNQHKNINKHKNRPRKFRRLIKFSSDDSDSDVEQVTTIYYRREAEVLLPIGQHLAKITMKLEVKRYDYTKPTLEDDDIDDPDVTDVVDLTSNQYSST